MVMSDIPKCSDLPRYLSMFRHSDTNKGAVQEYYGLQAHLTRDIEEDLAQLVACSTPDSKFEIVGSKRLADDADIVDVMLGLIDKYFLPRKLSSGRNIEESSYEKNVCVGLSLRGKATISRGFPAQKNHEGVRRLLKDEFNVDI
jgi:hypothetical protein